ncbi:mitochondrial dynamin GTPase Msp1 [Blastocladiella emersonii ATCC 22665]|nr:mitochondrial dynamin GTPase Msp1 [Blastocladiella emersonii ATCC 22665]
MLRAANRVALSGALARSAAVAAAGAARPSAAAASPYALHGSVGAAAPFRQPLPAVSGLALATLRGTGARPISLWSRVGPLRRLPVLLGGGAASAYAYVQYQVAGTWSVHLVPMHAAAATAAAASADFGGLPPLEGAAADQQLAALAWTILALAVSTANWMNDKVDFAKSSFLDALDSVSANLSPLQDSLRQRLDLLQSQLGTFSRDAGARGGSNSSGSNSSGGSPGPSSSSSSSAAASGKGGDEDDDEDDRKHRGPVKPDNANDDEFMDLTKKLIEVRNILKSAKVTGNLVLPSIVVIGSQSSGKSSVLETIVGREFLPKGSNMVTRRPLELTLIHTPDSNEEYGEFPQLGLGRVTNFRQIQQTLYDLNMAVKDECVSDNPIELRIYSPNVPDLTLVDLPGYIQIHSKNQPRDLKEKIAALCEKYIQEPNLILAVCAADVDLANSEALRSSRRVDPLGLRTIGVLTKIDLVSVEQGTNLLLHNEYPLHLGYVGVVCSSPKAANSALAPYRRTAEGTSHVGIPVLRQLLMRTLEERMGSRLTSLSDAVEQELAETNYQFKVLYNDRRITAESYLAETMDTLKHRFKDFTRQFGKPQVRQEVRTMLEQRIVDICEQLYWTDPKQAEMNTTAAKTDEYWAHKLALASSALTKSGVGRSSTQLVVDSLMQHMEKLVANEPFASHPDTRRKVLMLANDIIRTKFHTTVDQVENTIKPYKFEVECTDQEWADATKRAVALLEKEIKESQKAYDAVKSTVGRRTLNGALSYLDTVDKKQVMPTGNLKPAEDPARDPLLRAVPSADAEESSRPSGYSDSLLAKARVAMYHNARMQSLYNRLYHIKSRSCRSPSCQETCPEIFLTCVSEKLTYTAVMFIYIELLNEFFFQFPRDVDERLYYDLSKQQIATFARENTHIRKQLDLAERKSVLDLAQLKLRALVRRQEEIARKKREQERDANRGGY